MAQKAQCARPRCAKAPSRRTGHGGCPRLANVARARESGLQGDPKICMTRTAELAQTLSRDPPNAPTPTKGAIRGPRYASSHRRYALWAREGRPGESSNQTIKCRAKINQSNPTLIPPIPSHPEIKSKQSKSRENPGKCRTLGRVDLQQARTIPLHLSK